MKIDVSRVDHMKLWAFGRSQDRFGRAADLDARGAGHLFLPFSELRGTEATVNERLRGGRRGFEGR